jgi:hypothetical protein
MMTSLNLSKRVSVNVLNFKAQGLDVFNLLVAEGLGADQLGEPRGRRIGGVRVNLRDTVNDFDGEKNNWHIDLQKVPSSYGRLDTPPEDSALPSGPSFALVSLGDWV